MFAKNKNISILQIIPLFDAYLFLNFHELIITIINMSCSDTDIFWRKGHKMKFKFGEKDTK